MNVMRSRLSESYHCSIIENGLCIKILFDLTQASDTQFIFEYHLLLLNVSSVFSFRLSFKVVPGYRRVRCYVSVSRIASSDPTPTKQTFNLIRIYCVDINILTV